MPVPPRSTKQYLPYYKKILKTFRNSWQMIPAFRVGKPCAKAVFWDGTRLVHPPHRAGLVETIIEVWWMGSYTREDWAVPFYTPKDGDVVLDVGANVGLFSYWLKRRSPGCRVVALEPFSENFEYLRRNLGQARGGGVEAHRMAIGGAAGRGRMIARGERSLDHVLGSAEEGNDADTVPVVPLSGLCELAGADRVSLLKLDVEGAERDAFESVDEATLLRFDRIAIEYHDNIRPGTLEVLKARLAPTHDLIVSPCDEGLGMLYGVRKAS